MNKQQLKQQLHKKIDAIEDENALHMLNEVAVEYTRLKDKEILDELSFDQLKEFKESIKQLDNGQWVSHEEVRKLSRTWLQLNKEVLEEDLAKGIQELDKRKGTDFLPFLTKIQQRYDSKK